MPPGSRRPGSGRSSSTTSRSRPRRSPSWWPGPRRASFPGGGPGSTRPRLRGSPRAEARAAGPGPRASRGLPRPRLRAGHLPLLRDPHQPRQGRLSRPSTSARRAPKVVHHINAFPDTTGDARKHATRPRRAGLHVVLRPGHRALRGPELLGRRPRAPPPPRGDRPAITPANATWSSRSTTTRAASRRSTGPKSASISPERRSSRRSIGTPLSNSTFQLPAGQSNIEVKATWFIPTDVEVLAVSPHMHRPGRRHAHRRHLPRTAASEDLIKIPEWDPRLADAAYYFQKPITLPRGSTIKVIVRTTTTPTTREPEPSPRRVASGFQRRRRDVRGLHRRREEGPGPDPAPVDRRPRRDLHQAARPQQAETDGQATPVGSGRRQLPELAQKWANWQDRCVMAKEID